MSAEGDGARKLKSILEALHSKNYRQVIKSASALEAKKPNWASPPALKACALHRLGKYDEAAETIQRVRTQSAAGRIRLNEVDARNMLMYYRQTGEELEAAAVSLEAWGHDPNNARLGEQTFFCYVNAAEFAPATGFLAKLQRVYPNNVSYSLWSIVTTVLQLRYSGADPRLQSLGVAKAKRIMPMLADRGAEVARVLLDLLCEAGQTQAAREALEKGGVFANVFASPSENLMELAKVHAAAGEAKAAADLYRQLLTEQDGENWRAWAEMIRLLFSTEGPQQAQLCLEAIDSIVERRQAGNAPGHSVVLLARCEVEKCRRERQAGEEDAAELPGLLLEYFEGMGDKAICASNVGLYLPCLTGAEADSLSAGIGRGVEGEDVRKTISRLWIQIGLGRPTPDAAELVRAYCSSAVERPVGSGRQLADDLLVIAARSSLPGSFDSPLQKVLEMLLVLEEGLRWSPGNTQFKLLLILMYNAVGAAEASFTLWRSMEVKHIQCLSLGYLVVDDLVRCGAHEDAAQVVQEILNFAEDGNRDSAEGVAHAFQLDSVSTAIDFLRFRDRMRRSRAVFAAKVHAVHLALATCGTLSLAAYRQALLELGGSPRKGGRVEVSALSEDADRDILKFWGGDSTIAKGEKTDRDLSIRASVATVLDVAVRQGLDALLTSGALGELEAVVPPDGKTDAEKLGGTFTALAQLLRATGGATKLAANGIGPQELQARVDELEAQLRRCGSELSLAVDQVVGANVLRASATRSSLYSFTFDVLAGVHIVLAVCSDRLRAAKSAGGTSKSKRPHADTDAVRSVRAEIGRVARAAMELCSQLEEASLKAAAQNDQDLDLERLACLVILDERDRKCPSKEPGAQGVPEYARDRYANVVGQRHVFFTRIARRLHALCVAFRGML